MRVDPRDLTDRQPATPPPGVNFRSPAGERPDRPERTTLRTGHRRELERAAPETRRTATERQQAALVDVATHRAIATRDLIDQQFGGHPYAGRRSIDAMKRGGLIEEHEIAGPNGGTFTVLTATPHGAAKAQELAGKAGHDPAQKVWSGLGRKGDLRHDVAIYRAVAEARHQLAAQGARVRRVRLDAELRGDVAAKSEAARARSGTRRGRPGASPGCGRSRPPHQRRRQGELSRRSTRIRTPDRHRRPDDGPRQHRSRQRALRPRPGCREGRGQVAAKAAAGMAVYAANGRAGRTVSSALSRAAKSLDKTGGSGSGGGRGRDPSSVEL